MKNKSIKGKKVLKIKGYMTFRDGKPLEKSHLTQARYDIYDDKAPIWQDGDTSVPIEITYSN